ncbi:sulfite exporter TauE/SafE family protein [Campylobacter pinnipediorum]|uniref:sulfite exporter TauE/SafE family protein n=1 Tax=Campylobacter pinnipediorum TaxID=1965231 RepID=UPI00084DEB77|nr:sulfite exporter TauE/SafE family protein [Campylobacter pinnipediorum]
MQELSFATIIAVGFLSSFSHCIGMCGGFLSLQSIAVQKKDRLSSFLLNSSYHIARIVSYSLLGAIFGAFGGVFAISSNSRALLFFIVGILLVLLATALWIRGGFLHLIENDKISRLVTKSILSLSKKGFLGFALAGFLNGLLPCGLVYYFLTMSIISDSALQGMLIMFVFGISTLPSMLGAVTLFGFISVRFKQLMFKVSLAIIMINGVYLAFLGYMAHG